eukprot:1570139-Karenia_brevis.AAC.1
MPLGSPPYHPSTRAPLSLRSSRSFGVIIAPCGAMVPPSPCLLIRYHVIPNIGMSGKDISRSKDT